MISPRLAGAVVGLTFSAGAVLLAGAQPIQQTPRAAAVHPFAAPLVTNGAWTVYHHDNAHTGFDASQPTAAGATTGWVSGTFDAQVYAEPLVYQGVVYVATLNNTVYALNQADGSTLWSKHLGAPETTGWICGNVSPQGILGTPVIDTASNRIYVAAFMSTDVWTIFGLDLAASGSVVLSTTIPGNFAGGFFDWRIQQERGALAVANGYVYVPFGGRAGDCNDPPILYQGWVFGIPTSGSTTLVEWNPGGSGGSGMWAPGGVVVDDTTGKVFVTTGNGGCPSTYDNYNDAIIRLSAALALEDYFAPDDWHDHWSCNDQDLGSASTVLISPNLAFQAGKWGNGFLVNPKALGGIDGQRYPTPSPATYSPVDVCLGNTIDANFGSYAYSAPYVYLSCESRGIVALKVDTSATNFSNCDAVCGAPSWHAGGGKVYGPPIVAGGVVWAVDTNGSGLTGFDAATGTSVFQSASFDAHRFSTPTEAGGQVFVASDNVVREFNIAQACTGATLGASPPSPSIAGTSVTLSGTVNSCPNPVYRFWVMPPGGAWGIVRDYNSTATFNWTSTGTVGLYHLEVDVKNTGSTASYDSVANILYTISSAAACTSAGLSVNPASPQPTGTKITLTGSSSGCPNPQYRFWIEDPGASRWSMVQDYSATITYSWMQTSIAGTSHLEVDVRDASESTAYDAVSNATYVLQPAASCTAATLTAAPSSPGPTGGMVVMTASSATCPNPRYRFWVFDAGGDHWSLVQDYSAATTHSWAGHGLAGTYKMEVDVRDASSTASYDAVFNTTYAVVGCSAAGLTAAPASPQPHGTAVVLSASSTCPGPAEYRFWILDPGASHWSMVKDYSPSNTYIWASGSTLAVGSYKLEVDVRDQGGTDTYEAVGSSTFTTS